MSPARRKKTTSKYRVLAGVLTLLPGAAFAQSADTIDDAVQACRQVGGMSARLACYDQAFPPQPGASERAAAARSSTPPEPTPRNGSAPDAGAAASTAAARVASAPDNRRARHAEPEDEPGEMPVRIVDVRALRAGETIFVTDAGDIYDQTAGPPRPRIPELPFDAALVPGAFGSMFIRLPDYGPLVRVRLRD